MRCCCTLMKLLIELYLEKSVHIGGSMGEDSVGVVCDRLNGFEHPRRRRTIPAVNSISYGDVIPRYSIRCRCRSTARMSGPFQLNMSVKYRRRTQAQAKDHQEFTHGGVCGEGIQWETRGGSRRRPTRSRARI